MKIKTSELTGAALDWAVAIVVYGGEKHIPAGFPAYSESWGQGGPIIERKKITLRIWDDEDYVHAYIDTGKDWFEGPTPLIAAMRCYVSSELGDEVEIPEELQ
jgi:hypothetical protein